MVDDEDLELVSKHKWHAAPRGNNFYAAATVYTAERKRKLVYMHRLILGESELHVDHHDGNGLNNTRSNLRLCTHLQNMRNQSTQTREKTSKYKGVYFHVKKWVAETRIARKKVYLGRFLNEIDAARAYDAAAKELFGDFARLNFPGESSK